jgi:hypothetical protein
MDQVNQIVYLVIPSQKGNYRILNVYAKLDIMMMASIYNVILFVEMVLQLLEKIVMMETLILMMDVIGVSLHVILNVKNVL